MYTSTIYVKCNKCNFFHFVDPDITDKRPTCKRCGNEKFSFKLNKKELAAARKMKPTLFCDWNLQETLEELALNISKEITSKYSGMELKHAIQDLFLSCINSNRSTFIKKAKPFYGKNNIKDKN
jgi:hypothetical protein